MSLCNNTSCIVANTVGCSVSVVSTIVHIIALGVLVFFKMYRKFVYRLLLYAFVALLISSISWTAYLLTIIKVQGQQVEFETFSNKSISIMFYYLHVGSLIFFYLIQTSMSLCMYILAIHHHQFTSWVADLIFLIVCLILSQIITISFVVTLLLLHLSPVFLSIGVTCYILISLANIGFTALTLMPMCCRACGYNLCTRSVATRESHRQALREILPLYILLSPSVGALASVILLLAWKSADIILAQWVPSTNIFIAGLLLPLSFAVHLYILGKTKLNKLRGKKRPQPTTYGTIANQPHTHRPTVFTSEGISETCNTDYPHVSEDEVDRELLHSLQQNNKNRVISKSLVASKEQQLINNRQHKTNNTAYIILKLLMNN